MNKEALFSSKAGEYTDLSGAPEEIKEAILKNAGALRGKHRQQPQREPILRLYNDNFQNYKRYNIPKAQLVIADIPYNIAENAYASRPDWYIDGDRRNGESRKAGKAFFGTDTNFNIAEYFHFCNRLLKKEPKEAGQAPCMIVFCSFQQLGTVLEYAQRHGFHHYIPLVFCKSSSAQVLKANMKIVGAVEYGLVLYQEKLPKFRNDGKMIRNWFLWERDGKDVPRIHPTQKPLKLLRRLISIYTDPGDVVIDPCAGSGAALRAAYELGWDSYGFEIVKGFCEAAKEKLLPGAESYRPAESAGQISLFE